MFVSRHTMQSIFNMQSVIFKELDQLKKKITNLEVQGQIQSKPVRIKGMDNIDVAIQAICECIQHELNEPHGDLSYLPNLIEDLAELLSTRFSANMVKNIEN